MSIPLRLLISLVVAWPALVQAQVARSPMEWEAWGRPLDPLGWTADSRFFVYTRRVEYYPLETIDDETAQPLSYQFAMVTEPRSGRKKLYLLELTLDGQPTMRPELDHSPRAPEFAAWLKEHPVVREPGFTHPRGATFEVTADRSDQPVELARDDVRVRFDLQGKKPLHLVMAVSLDGRRYILREEREKKGPYAGTVTSFFSPDGTRVALYVRIATDVGNGPTDYIMVAPVGPRIEVVVPAGERAMAGNAYAHIEHAGFTPAALTHSERTGDTTVILAASGFEEDAERLASRLHGEVTIEPMTRPGKYNLSVVAGIDMLQPVPLAVELLDGSVTTRGGPVHEGSLRTGVLAALATVAACLLAYGLLRLGGSRRG